MGGIESIESKGSNPVKMGIKTKPNQGRALHKQGEKSQAAFTPPTKRGGAKKTRRQRVSVVSKKVIRKKTVPIRSQRVRNQNDPDLLMEQISLIIDSGDTDKVMAGLQIGTEQPEEFSYEQRNTVFFKIIERFRTPTQRAELWKMIRFCAARPEIIARQLACVVLDTYWKEQKVEAERILLNLARDEDWEVREYAAATIARIVKSNFKATYPYLMRWATSPDPSVRRQIMVAIVPISDQDHPEWVMPLLDIVGTNMKDRDPYIRRNLGPFALGEGLLRNYPEETLKAMTAWAKSDDETTLWNVGMGLTVSYAGDYCEEALKILKSFGTDKRRKVWQAVSMALQNLLLLHPNTVEPQLIDWMKEDPGLRVAVSTALAAYRSMI